MAAMPPPRRTRGPLLLSLAITFASCTPAAPPPPPPPPPPPAPTSTSTAAAPAPPPPTGARIGPRRDGRFALAVDCTAALYTIGEVGKDLLGVCGDALENSSVFHIPDRGPARLAPEVFKGLSPRAGTPGLTLGVTWIHGRDLDHFDAQISELRTRTGSAWIYRRAGTAWKEVQSEAFYGFEGGREATPIGKRRLLMEVDDRGRPRFAYADGKPGWIPAAVRPSGCPEVVGGFSFLAVKGKNLWAMGVACGKLAAQRWTLDTTDTDARTLDLPGTPFRGWISAVGDTWIYVAGDGSSVARFDGHTWTSLGTLPVKVYGDPPIFLGDQLWMEAERRLFRLEGDRFREIPVPDGGVLRHARSDAGELRIATDKGLYSFGPGDAWTPIDAAVPSQDIGEMRHLAGRWIIVARPASRSDHLQIHVEGASGPAITITTPTGVVSPFSLVTPLRGSCESPFALLYKLARTAPAGYDFPATRDALKDRPDLAAGSFREITAFGDRYLVAQYEGPGAEARLERLAARVRDKVPGSTPQLLCADSISKGLPPGRAVPMK